MSRTRRITLCLALILGLGLSLRALPIFAETEREESFEFDDRVGEENVIPEQTTPPLPTETLAAPTAVAASSTSVVDNNRNGIVDSFELRIIR